MTKLYWTGGPARVSLIHTLNVTEADSKAAVDILEDFRSQCQRIWFAFDGMTIGRALTLQQLQQQKVGRHNKLSVGTQFPDQEQSVGKSTFAQITFGELFDAMTEGGEFEQLNAKALLVFIDVLWEESTRDRIADVLHVNKNDVSSDLMADLHRLRNLLVHQSDKAKQDYVQKATILPQLWTIDPDDVIITSNMLQALMEQLNAIQVRIGVLQ